MKEMTLTKALWVPFGAALLFLGSSGIASGNDENPVVEREILNFLSDGQPVRIDSLDITISPPAGWQVTRAATGMSLIMHLPHPDNQQPSYDSFRFQRNITVVTKHQATPIDEKTAERLRTDLESAMENDGLVSDFQVLEHKFFNYRGENDGIVLYSAMNLREVPMMQMHVLVSGSDKQFLLTYTDLADEFSANQDAFQTAWNTMTSIQVNGNAPVRYQQLMQYGGLGLAGLLVSVIFFILARRRRRNAYADDANSIYDDDCKLDDDAPMTRTGVWRLDASTSDMMNFEDDDEFGCRSAVSGGM